MQRIRIRKIMERCRFRRSFILYPLSFILFFSSCILLNGEEHDVTLPVEKQIDRLVEDSLLQKGMTGIRIIDANSGDLIYELNGDKYFSPASNMKLITTIGALFLLGPEFRYGTPLVTNGSIRSDTLLGDLIICGKGDPTLTTAHLRTMAQEVAHRGISVIKGDILFDDAYFDTIPYGPGWMWDDLQYDFSAPTNALSINRNCCSIHIMPGSKSGDMVRVHVAPATSAITVKNLAKTAEPEDITVSTTYEDGKNKVTVQGTLPVNSDMKRFTRSIRDPAPVAAALLSEELHQQGILITGTVKSEKCSGAETLFIHVSQPLLKILYDLDKYSSNFIAEHILKTIGAVKVGIPGTTEKGIEAIAECLQENALFGDDIIQRDGSGLSRYNLITPEQITSLLHYLYFNFSFGPELMTVLPAGGIDGTLKNRFQSTATKGKVRAKTGTMTHVCALSGYCITSSGRILIFSIMMKDFSAPSSYIRDIQDRIVSILIEKL
jgi:D-alanyl-D-alanine carboxypeptidase/D-alanyl-D-alanine-endopeptidase (penicillin-binding protein 4)